MKWVSASVLAMAAAIGGGVVGCDGGPPPYDFQIDFAVFESDGLSFQVDGEPVDATISGTTAHVLVERRYGSYAAAGEAAPIVLEAFRSGASAWSVEQGPDVCGGEEECGDIVEARYNECLDGADGSYVGLCAGLTCSDGDGPCGGWISRTAPVGQPR